MGKFGDTALDAILLTDKSGPFFDYMHTPALKLFFSDTGKKNVISYITP